MRFNLEAVTDRYALVAQVLDVAEPRASDEANANAAIDAVMALSARVGTAKSLVELGATSDHLSTLVEQALSDLIILTTPRYPSRAEVHDLYWAAMASEAVK